MATSSTLDTDLCLLLEPVLPVGQVLFDRNGSGGGISHRGGDLTGQLGPHVASCEEPGKRSHHPLIGDEIPTRVMYHVLLHQSGVGTESDEHECTGRGQ